MTARHKIKGKRDIIDRQRLTHEIDALAADLRSDQQRDALVDMLRTAYREGWDEIKRRFEAGETGHATAQAHSFLVDQLIRVLYDFTTSTLYPMANPTLSERLVLAATGGYGRGELAPYSDIDILFLFPYKRTPWVENVAETIMIALWDIGLKVGHAMRTGKECVSLAKKDVTIRTSLVDARYLWGDQSLYDTAFSLLKKDITQGSGRAFVEDKLAERNARHERMGDSRYVVEPNLKDGKGGQRDLQTLLWIGRYLYGVREIRGLVEYGVITEREAARFEKAEDFLWTVRCTLHYVANRAREQITFDAQPEIASRLHYRDHPGLSGTERFMKHYFLVAKEVGDLTRVFCASLEERRQKMGLLAMPRLGRKKHVDGFLLDRGRLNVAAADAFEVEPRKLVSIFAVAERLGTDIHPEALTLIRRNLKRIDHNLRRDEAANAAFIEVLTSPKTPEVALRRMNEAGVFGRFVPDFGRIVAQMQHDMYHHYTVDEHTIRAIGILSKIEKGEMTREHPVASKLVHTLSSRRALYVAVLLHDIAKGRGGDHTALGEEVARELCPRLGLDAAETDHVAWLVRYHLHMSGYAFKRDLADPKTIEDFAAIVKSPERLRLLAMLTIVDIKAVGPGIWNGWKSRLLRDLFELTQEHLLAGHVETGRARRVEAAQQAARYRLGWTTKRFTDHAARLRDAYWLAEEVETQVRNAVLMNKTDGDRETLGVAFHVAKAHEMTEIAVYAKDQPGLFARLTGALAEIGANIVDAKIFTTRDGRAIDNFTVQDAEGHAFEEARKLARIREVIVRAVETDHDPSPKLNRKPLIGTRKDVFRVEPFVIVDNRASEKHSVIEVNARDRPGLLYDLARAFITNDVSVVSAHIATYGERAVDVFYVQDLEGRKVESDEQIAALEAGILNAVRQSDVNQASLPDQKRA